jgi:uncharacterized membrane protein YhfC
VFAIVYPFMLAFVARSRLHVGWRYFWYGALVFAVFQIFTRVPVVTVLNNVLASQLRASAAFRFAGYVILALTAGLFEEVGRYVGYRILMRREEKTWRKAIMYGIGHGGIESIVIVGLLGLLSLFNLVVTSTLNLNTLTPAQHATVVHQFALLNAQPVWQPLLGAWERLWTLPIHIALSVVVLQVFRRKNIAWLGFAIFVHAVVDFTSIEIAQVLGASTTTSLITEGVVALFGILALMVIWRLRDTSILSSPTEQVVLQN